MFDVVVLGGGAAGMSGALTLARSLRSVLVVDGGSPRNAPADGVHGLLGNEGTPPLELLARARADVVGYGAQVIDSTVVAARATGDAEPRFTVTTGEGEVVARRLLVATGVVDVLPDVDGLAGRWGRDVLHCPYCHGWEVRGRRVAVLSTGPMSTHQALLFRQLTPDVTVLRHTGPAPTDEQQRDLTARGVTQVDGEVTALEVHDDVLVGVRLASGEVVPADAVVVGPSLRPRLDGLEGLALPTAEITMGDHVIATHVVADPHGATSVPGVWAAGNVATPMAQVVHCAGAGLTAGAQINADLVAEDVRAAHAST